MTLDCLSNLVGIKKGECIPAESESGLYLDDLPFINIETANATANASNPSGLKLIQNKLDEAAKTIAQEIFVYFSPVIKKKSIIDNAVVGYYQQDMDLTASEAAKYIGVQFRLDTQNSFELFISSISIQSNTTVTIPILVFNLLTGKQIDTFNIDAVADESVSIDVFKKYGSNSQRMNLFFCYDASLTGYYQSNVYADGNSCGSCSGKPSGIVHVAGQKISQAAQKIDGNLTSMNGTGGLSITYSLNCTVEPYICSIKNILAWPLRHQAAILILTEMIYSKRVNGITITYNGDIKELRNELIQQYSISMSRILENLPPADGICFTCNPKITKRIQVP